MPASWSEIAAARLDTLRSYSIGTIPWGSPQRTGSDQTIATWRPGQQEEMSTDVVQANPTLQDDSDGFEYFVGLGALMTVIFLHGRFLDQDEADHDDAEDNPSPRGASAFAKKPGGAVELNKRVKFLQRVRFRDQAVIIDIECRPRGPTPGRLSQPPGHRTLSQPPSQVPGTEPPDPRPLEPARPKENSSQGGRGGTGGGRVPPLRRRDVVRPLRYFLTNQREQRAPKLSGLRLMTLILSIGVLVGCFSPRDTPRPLRYFLTNQKEQRAPKLSKLRPMTLILSIGVLVGFFSP